MKKKLKTYFTINQDLYDIFLKYVDENTLDKSKLISLLIYKYLNEKGIKTN